MSKNVRLLHPCRRLAMRRRRLLRVARHGYTARAQVASLPLVQSQYRAQHNRRSKHVVELVDDLRGRCVEDERAIRRRDSESSRNACETRPLSAPEQHPSAPNTPGRSAARKTWHHTRGTSTPYGVVLYSRPRHRTARTLLAYAPTSEERGRQHDEGCKRRLGCASRQRLHRTHGSAR